MTSNEKQKGRIEVSIGRVSFLGEGGESWLADQLDKVLKAAESHPAAFDEEPDVVASADPSEKSQPESNADVGTLATYLRSKNASSQVLRFLATAAWLTMKGATTLKTGDVTKALRENHQSKLGNASECLNNNVSKGYCEKTPGGFFVTPEGRSVLGE